MKIIKFEVGPYPYKYTAILSNGKKVSFGHQKYQQYHDKIGYYKHLDHNDKKRRDSYRARHTKIKLKDGSFAVNRPYSPAWFSLHYLW